VALAKLHESDAVLAAVAEELSQLGSLARSAKDEAEHIAAAIATAESARADDAAGLAELEERLVAAESDEQPDPDTSARDRLGEEARAARQAETDARLVLRTAEERVRALQGRAAALDRAASEERAAQARVTERRARHEREAATAEEVAAVCDAALPRLERTLAEAAERRSALEATKADGEAQLTLARRRVRTLEAELAALTDSAHHDEMLHTEYRLRREQLELRSRDEVGLDLEALVADYGPDQPVPLRAADAVADAGPDGDPVSMTTSTGPFVRAEMEKRLRIAERDLAELGRINPLALEEFGALEERHSFLGEQLDDLRRTRQDLLDIVKEVDARVGDVFAAAFEDVAREFATVFERLFPGGEGQLVLTEPGQLLETGIDVEARPAGKRVKRLSLLSGGERALVAVAFLVALFKARPSPFYILDEVEAALDDTNLGRLLSIYEELREESQLVVITHQKRTMSIADALYGVSMRGDGVSTVISQRLRESATA
jgi:chromosome segregation protein